MDHQVRPVRVRKSAGMQEGLIWAEVFLPFDPVAFATFEALALQAGSYAAAGALNPELATKALAPIDAHGEAMPADDLLVFAHGWLDGPRKMDVLHDEVVSKAIMVVESFVNTPEIASPHFYPGAWVLCLQLAPGSPEWAGVDSGALDSLSFQTTVTKRRIVASLGATS